MSRSIYVCWGGGGQCLIQNVFLLAVGGEAGQLFPEPALGICGRDGPDRADMEPGPGKAPQAPLLPPAPQFWQVSVHSTADLRPCRSSCPCPRAAMLREMEM